MLTNFFTPDAVHALVSSAQSVPDDAAWAIVVQFIFGEPITPRDDSCFQIREPFLFMHVMAPVALEDLNSDSKQWAEGVYNDLKNLGLIKTEYLAIMGPESSAEECFGKEDLARLKALKKKIDPENVFKHVPANLADA